jgi:hypothetical protein
MTDDRTIPLQLTHPLAEGAPAVGVADEHHWLRAALQGVRARGQCGGGGSCRDLWWAVGVFGGERGGREGVGRGEGGEGGRGGRGGGGAGAGAARTDRSTAHMLLGPTQGTHPKWMWDSYRGMFRGSNRVLMLRGAQHMLLRCNKALCGPKLGFQGCCCHGNSLAMTQLGAQTKCCCQHGNMRLFRACCDQIAAASCPWPRWTARATAGETLASYTPHRRSMQIISNQKTPRRVRKHTWFGLSS